VHALLCIHVIATSNQKKLEGMGHRLVVSKGRAAPSLDLQKQLVLCMPFA
jgi:hypothetical protein